MHAFKSSNVIILGNKNMDLELGLQLDALADRATIALTLEQRLDGSMDINYGIG